MSLRFKTLLIIGLTLAGITTMMYAIASRMLLRSFDQLEDARARLQVERIRQVLLQEIENLDSKVSDYSRWDDLYSFAQNGDPEFSKLHFTKDTYVSLKLDLIAVYDSTGKRAFAQRYNPVSGEFEPPPADLRDPIGNHAPLLQHKNVKSSHRGVVLFKDSAWMISSRPILSDQGAGPVVGTVLMGRMLDKAELDRLTRLTQQPFVLSRCDQLDADESAELRKVRSFKDGVNIDVPSRQTSRGYTYINDVYGAPAVLLRVDLERDIFREGESSIRVLALSLLMVGLVFGIVALLILERMVLSRVAHLSSAVSSIAASGDFSRRVELTGKDEMARLSGEIDGMLAAQQQSQRALKESEAALRQSEESHRKLIETSPDGILVLRGGRIVYINHRGAQMLGGSQQDLLNKPLDAIVVSASDSGLMARVQELSGVSEFDPPRMEKFRRLDGTTFDAEVLGAACPYNGEPAVLMVARDITERQRAEEERSRLQTIAASRQRLALLGEFAAGVAHEFRNPLHGVHNCIEMLRPKNGADPRNQELWELAEEGLRRMDLISGRMLHLVREGVGPKVPVDASTVIEESVAFVRQRALKEGVTIECKADPDLPPVPMDSVRISEAILNLLVNALDACEGGGKITVTAARRKGDASMAEIVVSDTGEGIPPELLAKIFDPFFTTKPLGKGSGLGLAITRGIIDSHAGVVEVRSEVNVGTSVTLCLPLEPAPLARRGSERVVPSPVEGEGGRA